MKKILIIASLFLLFVSLEASSTDLNKTVLKVGTKVAPPFAMKDENGKWVGISIELWDLVAKKLGVKYTLQEENLTSLLNKVAKRDLDLGIAALTITPDRERRMDFSHSYYTTGLAIAVPKRKDFLPAILDSIFSIKMLFIVLAICGTIVLVGVLIWATEKNKNPSMQKVPPVEGIKDSIWWAATTLTIVGHENMTPKSAMGRMIAFLWMLASIMLVASVIAGLSSLMTVSKIEGPIAKEQDLARGKVASIKGSTSDAYLRSRRIYPKYYNSIKEGLEAVKSGKVDAMVYDKPLMNYYINSDYSESIIITGGMFEPQNYSIIMQEGSSLDERINRALLDIIYSPQWQDILHKYLDAE